jgi:hypothetical protein
MNASGHPQIALHCMMSMGHAVSTQLMHTAAEASDPGTDPSGIGMEVIIASLMQGTGESDAASGAASAAASGAT